MEKQKLNEQKTQNHICQVTSHRTPKAHPLLAHPQLWQGDELWSHYPSIHGRMKKGKEKTSRKGVPKVWPPPAQEKQGSRQDGPTLPSPWHWFTTDLASLLLMKWVPLDDIISNPVTRSRSQQRWAIQDISKGGRWIENINYRSKLARLLNWLSTRSCHGLSAATQILSSLASNLTWGHHFQEATKKQGDMCFFPNERFDSGIWSSPRGQAELGAWVWEHELGSAWWVRAAVGGSPPQPCLQTPAWHCSGRGSGTAVSLWWQHPQPVGLSFCRCDGTFLDCSLSGLRPQGTTGRPMGCAIHRKTHVSHRKYIISSHT